MYRERDSWVQEQYGSRRRTGKSFDMAEGEVIATPPELVSFFEDIDKVCQRHQFSLSHEDLCGAFIVEPYKENNMNWLFSAFKNY